MAVFLFSVLASSCAFSRSGRHDDLSTYCSLLHVEAGAPKVLKKKPFLGVTMAPKDIGRKSSLCKEGSTFIEIEDVLAGTPADKAGLKKGDTILSFNGMPLCRRSGDVEDAFKEMIARERVGSVVELDTLRGKTKFTAYAKLTEIPLHEQPEAAIHRPGRCPEGQRSELERVLRNERALAPFREVLSGLRQTSNQLHNAAWFSGGPYNPFQLKEFTYLIRHPLEDGQAARELTDGLIGAGGGKDFRVGSVVERAASLIDAGLTASGKGEITFPGLIRAMEAVKQRLHKCFSRLTPVEMKLLREKALGPWQDSRWNDTVKTSMKIDVRELMDSFAPLLPFFSRENLSLLRQDLIARFGNNARPILFEAVTPLGKVIVGGPGRNVYKDDAALILDVGGDDVYLNNAGGTRPEIPVALVVDWGGNDIYLTKEDFSQGAGLLGGGFLFDLSGNDVFESLDGSQGAGFYGIGILYHGQGQGLLKARSFSQGMGEMGVGLLMNGDGNTRYLCSGNGQGLGLFRGFGLLMDDNGDDYYQLGGHDPDFRDPAKSTVSVGQGFGFGVRPEDDNYGVSGGLGILIDVAGNDIYDADYFAQGASYYYGAGILDDLSGDDLYIAGRYAQGAGIHSSVGILEDRRGDDFYYSSFGVAQGIGHDCGVGYLGDEEGNDRYIGGILSQGAATRGGAGILADGKGDDYFMCGNECQAFAGAEKCIGILADGEPGRDSMSRHRQPKRISVGLKRGQQGKSMP